MKTRGYAKDAIQMGGKEHHICKVHIFTVNQTEICLETEWNSSGINHNNLLYN